VKIRTRDAKINLEETVMKRTILVWVALLALAGVTVQKLKAGSAVAADGHGNLSTAYGGPVDREKQRALDKAHRRYGFSHFTILASTNISGYGAVAVALHPNGHDSLVGIALGKKSQAEAVTMALDHCRKAGGTHARVRWCFWG
jgi:hypothetical protein